MHDNYKIIFIKPLNKNIQNQYEYEFLFSDDISMVYGQNWDHIPCSVCGDIPPEEGTYDLVKRVICDIKFDVAQENSSFSMQDCIEDIIALGWENVMEYDDYPDERLVIHYGEDYDVVEKKLLERNIELI